MNEETARYLAALEQRLVRMDAQLTSIHEALFPKQKTTRRQQIAAAKAEILTRHNKGQ